MSRRDRVVVAVLVALAVAFGIAAILGDRAAAAWPGRNGSVVYLGVRKAYAPSGGSLIAVSRAGNGPRLVRINLRDPRHLQPLLGGSLASTPVWSARSP